MKVTVEQTDRQRKEELIVRCHDPGRVPGGGCPGSCFRLADGLRLAGGYAAPAETVGDLLRLTREFEGLPAGTKGTIVLEYNGPQFEVEFFDEDGDMAAYGLLLQRARTAQTKDDPEVIRDVSGNRFAYDNGRRL